MIKATPELNREKITDICGACGVIPEENALCYFIYSDGSLIGFCLFKLTAGGGRVIALRNTKDSSDRDALVIAGRACLDFIQRQGGNDAIFEENDTDLAYRLGFEEKGDRLYLNLSGYFSGCCALKTQ